MKATGIEFTHSGVSLKGDWAEVCSFAEDFENIIRKTDASNRSISRYSDWRPRRGDSNEDIKQKTVEGARLDVDDLEKNGLAKKVDDICENEDVGNLKTALSKMVKELYLGSARYFSKMEEVIYGRIMLNYNPYFFDDAEFSANLHIKNRSDCRLKFNFSDESVRDRVKDMVKG